MMKEIFLKGSIEAAIGAGLAVFVNAFVLANPGIVQSAISAGIGAMLGNMVRVFILKRS